MPPPVPSRFAVWLARLPWLLSLPAWGWALAVLLFSGPVSVPRVGGALLLAAIFSLLARKIRLQKSRSPTILLAGLLTAAAVAALVRPRNDRAWAADFARIPQAEIAGDTVTLHHYRNFDWHSATEATERWETRAFPLSALRHVDFIMVYWGSPHVCHTMVTFDFGAHGRVCASIEARREADEHYSPLAGAFRRYELAYVLGDERDLLRVRTHFRPGNEVYLFRLAENPAAARIQFLDYLRSANELRERPAWYNSVTTNCSTLIRRHAKPLHANLPLDWRLLANGHADEYLYRLGYLPRELPLGELKRRSHINDAARRAPADDFSAHIRAGRPGFKSK